MMANLHYNRTTTLEKREKIIALLTSGSKQAQIAEEVGLSPQTVSNIVNKFLHRGTYFSGKPGWKERTVSTPDVVEFVEYSLVLSFLSILINVFKERSLYDITIAGHQHLEETVQLFSRDRENLGSCSVAHSHKNSQTCLQNIEVTLETFWKISTSSCHEVPNELSILLMQVATCSTQTVNQNTNIVVEFQSKEHPV